MASPQPNGSEGSLWPFATRVLVAVAIVVGVYLAWQVRFAILTVFAAVLLAVLLLAIAGLLRRFVAIGHGWAILVTVGLIAGIVAAMILLVGTQVQSQFGELWRALPQASEALEERLGIQIPGQSTASEGGGGAAPAGAGAERMTPGASAVEQILGDGTAAEGAGVHGAVLSRLANWLTSYGLTIFDAILGVVLVLVAGVYLALDPHMYRRGAVKLFPPPQHQVVGETMTEIGQSLRLWLLGKLISMALIGVIVGFGTWVLGLPAPLALGIFAGLTEFVPIVGPIIGAVPALLLAATDGPSTVLWTLALFLGVQQIESNLIAPNVEGRMVTIPPALFVLGVGFFGGLFGLLGLVLSGPLLVVAFVAVKKLWVREALHESTSLPSEAQK